MAFRKSDPSDRPEMHGMSGWGKRLGADVNEPRSQEDAETTALLFSADRLNELVVALHNLNDKLDRVEIWLETLPGYLEAQARRKRQSDGSDLPMLQQIAGVRIH